MLLGRCTGKQFNIILFHLLTKSLLPVYLALPNHPPLTPCAQPSVKLLDANCFSSKLSGAEPTPATTKLTHTFSKSMCTEPAASKLTCLKPGPRQTLACTGRAQHNAQTDQDNDRKDSATTSPASKSEHSETKTKDSEEQESADVCISCII